MKPSAPIPQGAPPQTGGPFARIAARTHFLLRGVPRHVAVGALGWIATFSAGQRAAENLTFAVALFLSFTVVGHGAALAVAARTSAGPWGKVVYRQLSAVGDHLMAMLIIASITLAMSALLFAIGLPINENGAAALAFIAAASVMLRLWPMWAIPFMRSNGAPETTAATGFWKKPALSTAWQLTRRRDAVWRFSIPWISIMTASVAGLLALVQAGWPLLAWGLLHFAILPGMLALTWAMTEEMSRSRGEK